MSAETSCHHCAECALFAGGESQLCMHPKLEADHFIGYIPLGNVDARNCKGFTQGDPQNYPLEVLGALEAAAIDGTGEVQPYLFRDALRSARS